jgi:hypothetical protein
LAALKFTKQVSLLSQPTTTAGTAYATPQQALPWLYASGNYDGTITAYLEVDWYISNVSYTAYAQLLEVGGSAVNGSEVTTQAGTAVANTVRSRSGDIFGNLTNAKDYVVQIKTSNASGTVNLLNARLIIQQSGAVTKTETVIELMGCSFTSAGTSYADITSSVAAGTYTHAGAAFDGTTDVRFEAVGRVANATRTCTIGLHDSANTLISSAEVAFSSTSYNVRTRYGSAVTLVDATAYKARFKTSVTTASSGLVYCARLIIAQTGAWTRTQCEFPIYKGAPNTSTGTGHTTTDQPSLLTLADFNTNATAYYFESIGKIANATATNSIELCKDDGTVIDTRTHTATLNSKSRGGSLDLSTYDGATLEVWMKTSATARSATAYFAKLIVICSNTPVTEVLVGTTKVFHKKTSGKPAEVRNAGLDSRKALHKGKSWKPVLTSESSLVTGIPDTRISDDDTTFEETDVYFEPQEIQAQARSTFSKQVGVRPVLASTAPAQNLVVHGSVHKEKEDRPVLTQASTLIVRKTVHRKVSLKVNLLTGKALEIRKTVHKEFESRPALTQASTLTVAKVLHREKAERPEAIGPSASMADVRISDTDVRFQDGDVLFEPQEVQIDALTSFFKAATNHITLASQLSTQNLVVAKTVHKGKSGRPEATKNTSVVTHRALHKGKAIRPALTQSATAVVRKAVHKGKATRPEEVANRGITTRAAVHREKAGRSVLNAVIGLTTNRALHKGFSRKVVLSTITAQTLVVSRAIHKGKLTPSVLAALTQLVIHKTVHREKALTALLPKSSTLAVSRSVHRGLVVRPSLRQVAALTVRRALHRDYASRPVLSTVSSQLLTVRRGLLGTRSKDIDLNAQFRLVARSSYHEAVVKRPSLVRLTSISIRSGFARNIAGRLTVSAPAQLTVHKAYHREREIVVPTLVIVRTLSRVRNGFTHSLAEHLNFDLPGTESDVRWADHADADFLDGEDIYVPQEILLFGTKSPIHRGVATKLDVTKGAELEAFWTDETDATFIDGDDVFTPQNILLFGVKSPFHHGKTTRPALGNAFQLVVRKTVHREKESHLALTARKLLEVQRAVHHEKSAKLSEVKNRILSVLKTIHREKESRPAITARGGLVVARAIHKGKARRPGLVTTFPLVVAKSFIHGKSLRGIIGNYRIVTASAYQKELAKRPDSIRHRELASNTAYHHEKSSQLNAQIAAMLNGVRPSYVHDRSFPMILAIPPEMVLSISKAIHRAVGGIVVGITAGKTLTEVSAYHREKVFRANIFSSQSIVTKSAIHRFLSSQLATITSATLVAQGTKHHGLRGVGISKDPGIVRNRNLFTESAYHDSIPGVISTSQASTLVTRGAFHKILDETVLFAFAHNLEPHNAIHRGLSEPSNAIRAALVSISNAIHASLSGKLDTVRAGQLVIANAVHECLFSPANVFSAARLLTADAIHAQLTGRPAVDKEQKAALQAFIARNINYTFIANREKFDFTARNITAGSTLAKNLEYMELARKIERNFET